MKLVSRIVLFFILVSCAAGCFATTDAQAIHPPNVSLIDHTVEPPGATTTSTPTTTPTPTPTTPTTTPIPTTTPTSSPCDSLSLSLSTPLPDCICVYNTTRRLFDCQQNADPNTIKFSVFSNALPQYLTIPSAISFFLNQVTELIAAAYQLTPESVTLSGTRVHIDSDANGLAFPHDVDDDVVYNHFPLTTSKDILNDPRKGHKAHQEHHGTADLNTPSTVRSLFQNHPVSLQSATYEMVFNIDPKEALLPHGDKLEPIDIATLIYKYRLFNYTAMVGHLQNHHALLDALRTAIIGNSTTSPPPPLPPVAMPSPTEVVILDILKQNSTYITPFQPGLSSAHLLAESLLPPPLQSPPHTTNATSAAVTTSPTIAASNHHAALHLKKKKTPAEKQQEEQEQREQQREAVYALLQSFSSLTPPQQAMFEFFVYFYNKTDHLLKYNNTDTGLDYAVITLMNNMTLNNNPDGSISSSLQPPQSSSSSPTTSNTTTTTTRTTTTTNSAQPIDLSDHRDNLAIDIVEDHTGTIVMNVTSVAFDDDLADHVNTTTINTTTITITPQDIVLIKDQLKNPDAFLLYNSITRIFQGIAYVSGLSQKSCKDENFSLLACPTGVEALFKSASNPQSYLVSSAKPEDPIREKKKKEQHLWSFFIPICILAALLLIGLVVGSFEFFHSRRLCFSNVPYNDDYNNTNLATYLLSCYNRQGREQEKKNKDPNNTNNNNNDNNDNNNNNTTTLSGTTTRPSSADLTPPPGPVVLVTPQRAPPLQPHLTHNLDNLDPNNGYHNNHNNHNNNNNNHNNYHIFETTSTQWGNNTNAILNNNNSHNNDSIDDINNTLQQDDSNLLKQRQKQQSPPPPPPQQQQQQHTSPHTTTQGSKTVIDFAEQKYDQ